MSKNSIAKVYYLNKKVAVLYKNRVKYDLSKATQICDFWNSVAATNDNYYRELLFVTDKNNFVLLGMGNRHSKYNRQRDDGEYVSARHYLIMNRLEAYQYLEQNEKLDEKLVDKYFFDLVEEG